MDDGAAAMSVTGTLSVGANDVVTVDISNVADSKSSVNLATFASGTVTAENFQVSPANPLYSFKVADGKVKLSCANGMQIIFR